MQCGTGIPDVLPGSRLDCRHASAEIAHPRPPVALAACLTHLLAQQMYTRLHMQRNSSCRCAACYKVDAVEHASEVVPLQLPQQFPMSLSHGTCGGNTAGTP